MFEIIRNKARKGGHRCLKYVKSDSSRAPWFPFENLRQVEMPVYLECEREQSGKISTVEAYNGSMNEEELNGFKS